MSKFNSENCKHGLPGYDMRQQEPRLPAGVDVTQEINYFGNKLPPSLAVMDRLFTKVGKCRYATRNGSTEAKMHFFVRLACPQEAVIVYTRNGRLIEARTAILDRSFVQELEKEENQITSEAVNSSNEDIAAQTGMVSSMKWLPQALMSAFR